MSKYFKVHIFYNLHFLGGCKFETFSEEQLVKWGDGNFVFFLRWAARKGGGGGVIFIGGGPLYLQNKETIH